MTERGTGGLDIVTQAEQVMDLPVTGAFPSGHRHFPSSDYTVHRRSDSFVSIKMLSTRTKSGELINGEGLQGARQSDSKLYLVLNGDEYLGRPNGKGLWPAIDWTRLPGITGPRSRATPPGATTTVSVADPAQGSGSLHVTVSGDFKSGAGGDSGATVTLGSTAATVAVDRVGGVTHTATLSTSAELPDATAHDAAGPDAGDGPVRDAGASEGADAGKRGSPDAGAHDAGGATEASSESGHGCSCRLTAGHPGSSGALCVVGLLGGFLARRRRTTAETSNANESFAARERVVREGR